MPSNIKFLIFNVASPFCSALALFLVAGLRYPEPVWMLGQGIVTLAIMVSIAFVIGHLILLTPIARADQVYLHLARTIAVGAIVSLPITLYFVINDISISRIVVLYELLLLFFLLITNSFSSHRKFSAIVNIGFLTVTGIASLDQNSQVASWFLPKVELNNSVTFEFANYHDVKITKYVIFDKKEGSNGGSIEIIGDTKLLLVNGNGKSFLINIHEKEFNVQPLEISVPINIDTYLEQTQEPTPYFRVTDILLEPSGGPVRKLYAAHHYLDTENKCYVLRLSETQIDLQNPIARDWVSRYTSTPCLKLGTVNNGSGGRLAFMHNGTILMTIGHNQRESLVIKDTVHYGKIMNIDPDDWSARIFTRGHRNPQGLLVGPDRIWSTEHGPEGGDELNVLEEGSDYGWPFASYGTEYGAKTPVHGSAGDHSRGQRPLYAWVPSIGISNLIRLTGSAFPAWKGDLLVASLNGASVFRVRIREERVVTIERLILGERIRDLVEMPSGKIVLWNGIDTIQILESASHVFSECGGCHKLADATHKGGIGPSLGHIVGNKVAAQDGYNYSEAMRKFGGIWTFERLDAFIANPARTVPGTNMQHGGIIDPDKRKEIIQLLQNRSDYRADTRR